MVGKIFANIGLGLFNLIFSAFNGLGISLDGLQEAYTKMFEVLSYICYFLPMGTIRAIFSIILAFVSIKISLQTLKTLWAILPIL